MRRWRGWNGTLRGHRQRAIGPTGQYPSAQGNALGSKGNALGSKGNALGSKGNALGWERR
jgi:hypothetical protein